MASFYYHPGFEEASRTGKFEFGKKEKLVDWIRAGRMISFQQSVQDVILDEKLKVQLQYQYNQISNLIVRFKQKTGGDKKGDRN